MNQNSNPPICKLSVFRETVLDKFHNEVVVKRNEQSKIGNI